MWADVNIRARTRNPTLIKCPVLYLGLLKKISSFLSLSFCAGLRVFLQVCEGRNKSCAISNSNLETRSGGSGVMGREVVGEPVISSIDRHYDKVRSAYHAITAGELGKTPITYRQFMGGLHTMRSNLPAAIRNVLP